MRSLCFKKERRGQQDLMRGISESVVLPRQALSWCAQDGDPNSPCWCQFFNIFGAPKLFPQSLWKSLWKRDFPKLQVPENFRLVALCTHRRQKLQDLYEQQFASRKRGSRRAARGLCLVFSSVFVASGISCAKEHRLAGVGGEKSAFTTAPHAGAEEVPASRLNLNTASSAELEKIPGIGPALASRIVAHRARHGGFRRAEHLMMVRGFSDRRFREVRPHLFVE